MTFGMNTGPFCQLCRPFWQFCKLVTIVVFFHQVDHKLQLTPHWVFYLGPVWALCPPSHQCAEQFDPNSIKLVFSLILPESLTSRRSMGVFPWILHPIPRSVYPHGLGNPKVDPSAIGPPKEAQENEKKKKQAVVSSSLLVL